MVTKTPDGGRKPRVTDEEILDVFRATDDPVLSTAEVADALPIKRRGTLTRLQSLEDAGEIDSKPIGGRNTVWWLASETADSPRGSAERQSSEQHDQRPEPTTEPPASAGDDDTPDDIDAVVESVADGWEDAPDRLEARKAAARAALVYAREHGGISRQEAKEEVEPEHPVENQTKRTWYRKNINPVLKEAGEYNQSTRQYELAIDGGDT